MAGEVNALQKEIETLGKRKEEAKAELDRELVAINQAKAEKEEIERELSLLEGKVADNQARVDEVSEKRVEQERLLEELDGKVRERTGAVEGIEARIELLKSDEASYHGKAAVRESEEKARIEKLLEDEITKLAAAKQEQAEYRAEYERIKKDYDKTVGDYKDLVAEEARVADRIRALREEDTLLRTRLDTLSNERKSIEESITAFQAQYDDLETRRDAIKAEITAKQDELTALVADTEKARTDLAEAVKEYDEQKTKLFLISQREKTYASRVAQLEQRYKEAGIAWTPIP